MRKRLSTLLVLGLSLPFLGKPVHVDDANFLAMAQQAAADPWRPHAFTINWQGTSELAFNVLSNPPGIAWWLAPVSGASIVWLHVWMLPWLLLAVWGAAKLGSAVADRPSASIILLCGAPISVLATQALTPDLPLLALSLAGFGGLFTASPRSKWMFALMLGASALFRYSGLALIPLLLIQEPNRKHQIKLLAWACIPITALVVHDWLAYDQVHLLAMMGFQSVSNTGIDMAHKAIASIAALGGAAVLPILCWKRARQSLLGVAIGAGIGCTAAAWTQQTGLAAWGTIFFSAAGCATLAGAVQHKDPIDRFLLAWLGMGAVFLLGLRFSASRYWIPFFAPVVLLSLRSAHQQLVRIACILTVSLSLGLAADDMDLANSQRQAAQQASTVGIGKIAGHWGFQHHLEDMGWSAAEDDQSLQPNTWLAISRNAWPQQPSNTCWTDKQTIALADPVPGLRVLTYAGAANIHGNMLAGQPPPRTFSPWSIASDPMDYLSLQRTCP